MHGLFNVLLSRIICLLFIPCMLHDAHTEIPFFDNEKIKNDFYFLVTGYTSHLPRL
jgi:hypothetical protein